MNDLRTAAQQALEALEQANEAVAAWGSYASEYFQKKHDLQRTLDAMQAQVTALRAALAQQAEPLINQCGETCERAKLCAVCARGLAEPAQEPVATLYGTLPIYDTAPPKRLPLTDEEIHHATRHCGVSKYTATNIARAVEQAHGIKE